MRTRFRISLDMEFLVFGKIKIVNKGYNKMIDNEITKEFMENKIHIVTETARYVLPRIPKLFSEKIIELNRRCHVNPDYIRRHRWSPLNKSRLIESFLMNVPVPPVILYENIYPDKEDNPYFEIIDGYRRLKIIDEFYNNKFRLEYLMFWPELNGRTYKTLPSMIQDRFNHRYISAIIILNDSSVESEKLKNIIFAWLNH